MNSCRSSELLALRSAVDHVHHRHRACGAGRASAEVAITAIGPTPRRPPSPAASETARDSRFAAQARPCSRCRPGSIKHAIEGTTARDTSQAQDRPSQISVFTWSTAFCTPFAEKRKKNACGSPSRRLDRPRARAPWKPPDGTGGARPHGAGFPRGPSRLDGGVCPRESRISRGDDFDDGGSFGLSRSHIFFTSDLGQAPGPRSGRACVGTAGPPPESVDPRAAPCAASSPLACRPRNACAPSIRPWA